MNGAMVAEIEARGWTAMISADVAGKHRIGVDRCAVVFMHLAIHSNADGRIWHSLLTLSEDTGLPVRLVREALTVLRECGLIRRDGKVSRNDAYLLDRESWPPESAGDRAGNRAGKRAGIPAKKRREVVAGVRTPTSAGQVVGARLTVSTKDQLRQDEKSQDQPLPGVAVTSATQGKPQGDDGWPMHQDHNFAYRTIATWCRLRQPGIHAWPALQKCYDLGRGDPLRGWGILKARLELDNGDDHGNASRPGALVLDLTVTAEPATSPNGVPR